MKSIDLSASSPTLADLLHLAGEENVILRTADGREFVLAEIDDFEAEVAATRQNEELMQLLVERGKEKGTYSLQEVKERLGIE